MNRREAKSSPDLASRTPLVLSVITTVALLMSARSVESHYQTTIFDMKSELEERIKRADDISKAYKHFRLEVAKSAEHSKTARPISEKLLAQMEADGGLFGLWNLVSGVGATVGKWAVGEW